MAPQDSSEGLEAKKIAASLKKAQMVDVDIEGIENGLEAKRILASLNKAQNPCTQKSASEELKRALERKKEFARRKAKREEALRKAQGIAAVKIAMESQIREEEEAKRAAEEEGKQKAAAEEAQRKQEKHLRDWLAQVEAVTKAAEAQKIAAEEKAKRKAEEEEALRKAKAKEAEEAAGEKAKRKAEKAKRNAEADPVMEPAEADPLIQPAEAEEAQHETAASTPAPPRNPATDTPSTPIPKSNPMSFGPGNPAPTVTVTSTSETTSPENPAPTATRTSTPGTSTPGPTTTPEPTTTTPLQATTRPAPIVPATTPAYTSTTTSPPPPLVLPPTLYTVSATARVDSAPVKRRSFFPSFKRFRSKPDPDLRPGTNVTLVNLNTTDQEVSALEGATGVCEFFLKSRKLWNVRLDNAIQTSRGTLSVVALKPCNLRPIEEKAIESEARVLVQSHASGHVASVCCGRCKAAINGPCLVVQSNVVVCQACANGKGDGAKDQGSRQKRRNPFARMFGKCVASSTLDSDDEPLTPW